jgi:pyruvate/2-oxoglutarate/acetoin dehydrogenase E1 component
MNPYKQSLSDAMDFLAKDPLVRFVGYGLLNGRAGGTLKNVPAAQIVETPTAENLMTGIAMGLSLKGLKPVLYFERADFVLEAMSAIVNHLAAMKTLSKGEFNPTCIIRVTVGNRQKPLFTGPVHTQDITYAIARMVSFPVITLDPPAYVLGEYRMAHERLHESSTMLVEYKDFWT